LEISGTSGSTKNPLIATGREMTPSITKSLWDILRLDFNFKEWLLICLPLPAFKAPSASEMIHTFHEIAGEHTGNTAAGMKDA
jgi:hypothetical protein